MKFRNKINGKYYPGYHEDMRDAVAAAIRALSSQPVADEVDSIEVIPSLGCVFADMGLERPGSDGWLPIETAPKDGTPIIIAVPTKDKDGFIVGEAYFDPKNYEGGDWWWAGTSHPEHFDSPISEINHTAPTHWPPLPAPPGPSA